MIVLSPGTRYIGGKRGCDNGYGASSVCVTIAVTIKCSNAEKKCDLSGQSTPTTKRRIMEVETGETGSDKRLTLESLSFEDGYAVRNS